MNEKFLEIVTQLAGIGERFATALDWVDTFSPAACSKNCPQGPGIRSPRIGRKHTGWTSTDRDYEQIRVNIQTLFDDVALTTRRR